MKKLVTLTLSFFLFAAMTFADGRKDADPRSAQPAKPEAAKKSSDTTVASFEAELDELRHTLQSQQEEIQRLKEQLANRDRQMEDARATATAGAAGGKAAEAGSRGTEPSASAATPDRAVTDLAAKNEVLENSAVSRSVPSAAASVAKSPSPQGDETSPLQFHIGSAYITPVGFMDFTGFWRSKNGGSGIGTNFAGIPYGNKFVNPIFQSNLSEFRFSMQNSRIGFRVDALVKGAHVIGYTESDFLGNNPGNVAVSSNSNTFRSRLYWVDVRKDQWEVLGGQTWSLVTPGRTGISAVPGDLFFTQNIDVNYQLGLVWGRIPELRVVYHPSAKAAFAVALSSPEQYIGGSAGGPLITLPTGLAGTYSGQLNTGGNTLSVPNKSPDVIAKLALDPSKKLHFEIGGVERQFQAFNPNTAKHFSTTSGGGFVNLNFELFKGFRLLNNDFWSDGGGRYIFGQAPDLVVRADGSLSPLHAGSTVTGFECTHGSSLFYGYYGALYVQRRTLLDANGTTLIGYGYAGSPSSQNRSVQEATFGFNETFWKDAKYGALNLMGQYSYLTRSPWFVATGAPKNAHLSMVFLNLRYTLPGSAPTLGK